MAHGYNQIRGPSNGGCRRAIVEESMSGLDGDESSMERSEVGQQRLRYDPPLHPHLIETAVDGERYRSCCRQCRIGMTECVRDTYGTSWPV